jgi:hypothetical protein
MFPRLSHQNLPCVEAKIIRFIAYNSRNSLEAMGSADSDVANAKMVSVAWNIRIGDVLGKGWSWSRRRRYQTMELPFDRKILWLSKCPGTEGTRQFEEKNKHLNLSPQINKILKGQNVSYRMLVTLATVPILSNKG